MTGVACDPGRCRPVERLRRGSRSFFGSGSDSRIDFLWDSVVPSPSGSRARRGEDVSEDEARRAAEEARRRAEEEARRRAEEERLRKISESEHPDATRSMVCPHGNIVGKCSLCK